MSWKKRALAMLVEAALGERAVNLRRGWHRLRRRGRPVVEFFHQPDDPYSQLLAQALPRLPGVSLKTWLVAGPARDVEPLPEERRAYAWRDAALLARRYGLDQPDAGAAPAPRAETASGDARRRKLGHYQGGMLYCEGEWYWGVDRLPRLIARLRGEGVACADFAPVERALAIAPRPHEVQFFFSFRSPFSYLAIDRIASAAENAGAALVVRPVLPLVMRGVPVPAVKRRQLLFDAAREARLLGIPFGRICDPLGAGVERCMALERVARQHGRELGLLRSAARGIWAEGLDAASDRDLRAIAERAGLPWQEARRALGDDSWRGQAEANRRELASLGLWGVPSFRLGDFSTWGQDRIDWVRERLGL